jgi:hypothetical protein
MQAVNAFIDFCEHVHTQDHHECWSMTWLDTVRDGRGLLVRLVVHSAIEDLPDQIWEVGARSTHAFALTEFEFTDWTFTDDHALLWDHEEPFTQLNFTGPSCCHDEVLWNLHERHRAVAGNWIPFDRYLNGAFLANRLSGGSGVLADGPDRLLRQYAEVLRQSDLEPYFPYSPRPAHRWDDEHREWMSDNEKLSVLILGSSSYIVGSDFYANRAE